MRKIVQISVNSFGLFALCDDGTTWTLVDKTWKKQPPIPQEPTTVE